jgi:hypothetical protein
MAMTERKHAAIGAVGDFYMACGQQPLGREDPVTVAPKLPHSLAWQGAGFQAVQVLLSHLHRRDNICSGLLRHPDAFGVDQVGVFETTRTRADSLLASVGCTRVNCDRHAELMGGRRQRLHLVIEPCH